MRSVGDREGQNRAHDWLESEAELSKARCDDQGEASEVMPYRVDCLDESSMVCCLVCLLLLSVENTCEMGFNDPGEYFYWDTCGAFALLHLQESLTWQGRVVD